MALALIKSQIIEPSGFDASIPALVDKSYHYLSSFIELYFIADSLPKIEIQSWREREKLLAKFSLWINFMASFYVKNPRTCNLYIVTAKDLLS